MRDQAPRKGTVAAFVEREELRKEEGGRGGREQEVNARGQQTERSLQQHIRPGGRVALSAWRGIHANMHGHEGITLRTGET